jgi:hypothetical protein
VTAGRRRAAGGCVLTRGPRVAGNPQSRRPNDATRPSAFADGGEARKRHAADMTKPMHSSPGSKQPRSGTDIGRTGGNRRTGDYPRGSDALLPADGAPVRPAPELDAAPGAERVVLAHLVGEYRRMHGEHGHLEAGAPRPRRHLETEMAALAAAFERLLGEWIRSGEDQDEWRAALHSHAAIPGGITVPASRLIFRGRTAQSVDVDVRERADGEIEIDLDGKPSERLVDRLHLSVDADGWAQIADVHARETFDLPIPAERELRRWMRRGGTPPWEYAPSLLAEGIVDDHFAITPRGRRAAERAAS